MRPEDQDAAAIRVLQRRVADQEVTLERLHPLLTRLAGMVPVRKQRFSNMGSPDSVNECIFCHADDYNGGGVNHKADCLWVLAGQEAR